MNAETLETIDNRTLAAKRLHEALDMVNLATVPVVSTDRHITRKEQAAAARKLFRSLGLKGISITAPNYSMAHSVDVSPLKRDDYVFDSFGMVIEGDEARAANSAASRKIEAILAAAFPNHDDRSDSQSDHFDFCWSIS